MITDVEQVIRTYLPNVIHLSLGTSVNNQPWVCEVHFSYDDELNLYFISTANRRHSQEIAINPRVAGNIVKQHVQGEKPRGVYFEGTAKLLTAVNDQHPAYITYSRRFDRDTSLLDDADTEGGHKFYGIYVSTYYVFDSVESKPSHKYELPWRTKRLSLNTPS